MSISIDNSRVHGFLRAEGRITVNDLGEEVLLRGWGAGNWNNPEGFMIGHATNFMGNPAEVLRAGGMDRGRSFMQVVRETCGTAYMKDFWNRWMNTYMTEEDIALMEKLGYNSVRLPISARCFLEEEPGYIWVEEAFAMLDNVLDWCKKHHIYGILDLHAAVAGQSCLPCDDGIDNKPRLFMEEETYERTIVLMEKIAERYADHEGLGGYNIVNEPLSGFGGHENEKYLPRLKEFYLDCIRRMRVYDKNHLFLLEGAHFTNRVDIFDIDYDPECHNWGIAIHCYGKRPEFSLIAPALACSAKLNVPVWMAETGGDNKWMSAMYEMLLQYHIGYNIWSWKSAEGGEARSIVHHKLPDQWDRINNYVTKGDARPTYAESQAIFDQYIERLHFDNCTVNDHSVGQINRTKGAVIPASGFDFVGGSGVSYKGNDLFGNRAGFRPGCGMEMVFAKGYTTRESVMGKPRPDTDYSMLQLVLHEGEFACYTCRELGDDCAVALSYRGEGKIRISVEDTVLGEIDCPAADDLTETASVALPVGCHAVKVEGICGGVILSDILIK